MNIYAADEAFKWLLQSGKPFQIEMMGQSFEVTLIAQETAKDLYDYLRTEKGHVVEIFGGAKWRVF